MKSLITLAILFVGTFLLDACQERFGGVTDTNIAVVIKDKQGNNLLDQSSVGHYDATQIRLFSVSNGVRTEIANSKFKVTSEHGGSLNFGAEAASPNAGNLSVTAVVSGQNNEDVIESTVEHSKNSTQCSHVKCNGVTKYNKDSKTARVIEIILSSFLIPNEVKGRSSRNGNQLTLCWVTVVTIFVLSSTKFL